MHEYPITEQIIKICSKHCAEANAERVVNVKLVVGDRSGCVGESIQMYFDVIGEGTPVSYTHLYADKKYVREKRSIQIARIQSALGRCCATVQGRSCMLEYCV